MSLNFRVSSGSVHAVYLEFHKLLAQALHSQLVARILSIASFTLLLQNCLHCLNLNMKGEGLMTDRERGGGGV